jgi:catechol 2,3-dioxygenase-like lactoylglutathione lyase family enzyme
MSYILNRPAPACDPGSGLLLAEHFQIAYVTTDMDHARELFRSRLGIRQFARLEGPLASGGYIQAEFAWVGTIMYELICASGQGSALYMDRLPAGPGFAMKHHHLAYLVRTRAQWDAAMAKVQSNGWTVPHHNVNPLVEVAFIDVPELGHYLEYFLPFQAGLDFFDSVPRH